MVEVVEEVLSRFDTGLTACSTEFGRAQGAEDWLLTATYQLREETKDRVGCLWLHRLVPRADGRGAVLSEDVRKADVEAGVLDCKW
jgi:hypothetical protein